ncbi:HNH endonuclease [Chryseobacterium sp. LC2016-29]|uniref:HNH endonuclease n=1 Tax=Chryseobacterium sp. LC2016-29 TaxID=2897331 RepID=UPI001E3D6E7C|nr:HNH endonuclease [Chryseobacterium sp. LC2016-29]MCD0480812.1 HNH endonuclease [Chryseobacterium sp. LC2016-29]
MSSFIKDPYKFTISEKDFIKVNFSNHLDWDKPIFNTIKTNIRDYLRPKQANKCCYCKRELGYDIKDVDIEHIIPKSEYSNFSFEPKNLALSCPACNTKKGEKKILNKKIVRYPTHSKNCTIVHAHYDNYNENILIHNGCVFEALSSKGSNTITVCELFRLKVVEQKAKVKISTKNKNSQLVNLIMSADQEELKNAMVELMKRIK